MKIFKFLILFLVLFHSDIFGDTENEERVSIDFQLYFWPYDDWFSPFQEAAKVPVFYWKDGEEYKAIHLTVGENSPVFKYNGESLFTIYLKRYDSSEKKEIMVPYSQVRIDPALKEVILFLFVKDKVRNGMALCLAIDASEDDIPNGSAKLVNMSNQPIYLRTGQGYFDVGSLRAKVLKGSDYPDMRIPVYVFKKNEKGKYKRAFTTSYPLNDKIRMLIVLHQDTKGNNKFKMQTIPLR